MALSIRKNLYVTKLLTFITNVIAMFVDLQAFLTRWQYGCVSTATITNGTTAGKLQATSNALVYRIGGIGYLKAATDDLWNLAAETDTTSIQYRAYYLYLNASGTASIGAGDNAASAALAIAALPAVPTDKSVIGTYVAGPSTDFNGAGGLAAQGTIYNGWPTTLTLTSESMTLVNP